MLQLAAPLSFKTLTAQLLAAPSRVRLGLLLLVLMLAILAVGLGIYSVPTAPPFDDGNTLLTIGHATPSSLAGVR